MLESSTTLRYALLATSLSWWRPVAANHDIQTMWFLSIRNAFWKWASHSGFLGWLLVLLTPLRYTTNPNCCHFWPALKSATRDNWDDQRDRSSKKPSESNPFKLEPEQKLSSWVWQCMAARHHSTMCKIWRWPSRVRHKTWRLEAPTYTPTTPRGVSYTTVTRV